MKFLSLLFTLFFSLTVFAGFEGLNQDVSLKNFNRINCGASLSCTKVKNKFTMEASGVFSGDVVGDGGDQLYGFLNNQVAATATTITAAQCGSTFYNSGAVAINLPEASTVVGCKLSFVTLNAANFDVNPDNADIIEVQTNAAGDMIRNATLGNTITLQAVSASQWVVIGIQGIWADAN